MAKEFNREEASGLNTEVRQYVDLKVEELKLKAASGLSTALSRLLSIFVIVLIGFMVLGLLSYAALVWLDSIIGKPWGTLCVAGVLFIIFLILFLCRKKLFKNSFAKMFIAIFDLEKVHNARELKSSIETVSALATNSGDRIFNKVDGFRSSVRNFFSGVAITKYLYGKLHRRR